MYGAPGRYLFEQPKPADAPTAAGYFTGLEADLKPNGRYRGAEKLQCRRFVSARSPRRSLAAAVILRPQCPYRLGQRTNGYFGGFTCAVSIVTRHTSRSRTMTQPKCPPACLPVPSPQPKGIITRSPNGVARSDFCAPGLAARSNGRGKPGRPADSLKLRHRPVLCLSSMDRS